MAAGEFADFTLTGPRFRARGLPAENAPELAVYKQLIFTIARQFWLDAHPGRSRVPAGFKEAFDLRLTEVKLGSARPQLLLNRPEGIPDEDYVEWEGFYFKARDAATEAIRTVGSERVLPNRFPRSSVRNLRKLGRTLQSDEQITIGPPKFGGPKASLDENFRRVIAEIDDQLELVPESDEVTVEGTILEFDSAKASFRLQSSDGDLIECVLARSAPHLARAVRGALSLDGINAPDVLVTGEAILDEDGLFGVVSDVTAIAQVRSIAEKVIGMKLSRLTSLRDGWAGEGSFAPSSDLIAFAQDIASVLPGDESVPSVGPVDDGTIVLEWSRGVLEYTIHLMSLSQMYVCVDNTDTDELEERTLAPSVEQIVRIIGSGDLGV